MSGEMRVDTPPKISITYYYSNYSYSDHAYPWWYIYVAGGWQNDTSVCSVPLIMLNKSAKEVDKEWFSSCMNNSYIVQRNIVLREYLSKLVRINHRIPRRRRNNGNNKTVK